MKGDKTHQRESTIEVIVKVSGVETVRFTTDNEGSETVDDLNAELVSIIGERPLRKEKR